MEPGRWEQEGSRRGPSHEARHPLPAETGYAAAGQKGGRERWEQGQPQERTRWDMHMAVLEDAGGEQCSLMRSAEPASHAHVQVDSGHVLALHRAELRAAGSPNHPEGAQTAWRRLTRYVRPLAWRSAWSGPRTKC